MRFALLSLSRKRQVFRFPLKVRKEIMPSTNLLLVLQAVWIVLHVLGLGAAWGARMQAGGRRELLAHASFFACLVLIALATIVGHVFCLAIWPLSAATLVTMIVTATADFGHRQTAIATVE